MQEIIEANTAAALELQQANATAAQQLQQANATAAQQLQSAYTDAQQALNAIPEAISPTVVQNGNTTTPPAGLDNKASVQRLYIINNTTVLGSMSSFTVLKALILRSVTLNDSMRTAIQTLAKRNTLQTLDVQYWGANIGDSAFSACLLKHVIGFEDVIKIETGGFANCHALQSVSFPAVQSIGTSGFTRCSVLTTVYFPAATYISTYGFDRCSQLTTAIFPEVTTIGYGAFEESTSLRNICFPKIKTIGSSAFNNCPCGTPPTVS
jgi:hypothetical protein